MAKDTTVPVRIPRTILRRIARIAAHRDQSVPDYLAERLAPIVDEDERQMLADIKREKAERDKPADT
jgi:hypothetical protein